VGERPKLTASEIEAMLRAALQKLPSLRDTKSVRFARTAARRVSRGRRTRSNRKWSLCSLSLSTWRPSSVSCINNTTSISALRRQPEG
jgi:hypothetical protein